MKSSNRTSSLLDYVDSLHTRGISRQYLPRNLDEIYNSIVENMSSMPQFGPTFSKDKIRKFATYYMNSLQSPSSRKIADPNLQIIVDYIIAGLTPNERKIVKDIPIFDILYPGLNAFAIKSPSGERIITINFDTMLLLSNLNTCINSVLIGGINDKWQYEVRYFFSWCMYNISQNISLVKKEYLFHDSDNSLQDIHEICLYLQIEFILRHEYAHHILGHLDDNKTSAVQSYFGDDNYLDCFSIKDTDEIKADQYAIKTMYEYWSEKKDCSQVNYIYLAVDRLMAILFIIEFISTHIKISSKKAFSPPDHPPARIRKEILEKISSAHNYYIGNVSNISSVSIQSISHNTMYFIADIGLRIDELIEELMPGYE